MTDRPTPPIDWTYDEGNRTLAAWGLTTGDRVTITTLAHGAAGALTATGTITGALGYVLVLKVDGALLRVPYAAIAIIRTNDDHPANR